MLHCIPLSKIRVGAKLKVRWSNCWAFLQISWLKVKLWFIFLIIIFPALKNWKIGSGSLQCCKINGRCVISVWYLASSSKFFGWVLLFSHTYKKQVNFFFEEEDVPEHYFRYWISLWAKIYKKIFSCVRLE